jgi:hypothetical protein
MVMSRAIVWGRAVACWAAALVGLGAAMPPATTPEPTALELVRAFNARPLGSPGIRRVRLELFSGAMVTRTFGVVHAWRESPGSVTSLAAIASPSGLAGTTYLLSESAQLPAGLDVSLRLRLAGPRVLAIELGRFDEGLLGSDFSYADLLWRIPTAGRAFTLVGPSPAGGAAGWIVESRATTAAAREATAWARVRYLLSPLPDVLLLGAEYFEDARRAQPAQAPAKRLQVVGWAARDGVWSPSRMEMARSGGRRSVMTLESLQLRVEGLDAALFTPAALPGVGRQFEEGRPMGPFEERARGR